MFIRYYTRFRQKISFSEASASLVLLTDPAGTHIHTCITSDEIFWLVEDASDTAMRIMQYGSVNYCELKWIWLIYDRTGGEGLQSIMHSSSHTISVFELVSKSFLLLTLIYSILKTTTGHQKEGIIRRAWNKMLYQVIAIDTFRHTTYYGNTVSFRYDFQKRVIICATSQRNKENLIPFRKTAIKREMLPPPISLHKYTLTKLWKHSV